MGFAKGIIAGVLTVAGAVIGAAVINVIKDENKEKKEIKQTSEEMDRMFEEDDKTYKVGMKEFIKKANNELNEMSDLK